MSEKKVKVKMLADARPRGCAKLLEGKEYDLPKTVADRLMGIGKAELASQPVAKPRTAKKPKADTKTAAK